VDLLPVVVGYNSGSAVTTKNNTMGYPLHYTTTNMRQQPRAGMPTTPLMPSVISARQQVMAVISTCWVC